ncbi:MAG: RagB/SusD family nutrient uptake outer membrane protein [Bacteroidales bacterium]|nr:RagB/SusD family nutrient uptake outer membrane protein [Bacteroidales bacterium]
MKKKNFKFIICALCSAVLMFSSCNEWLDITSDQEVIGEDAFASTKGYRSALTGVYKIVASEALYGQELTWGLKASLAWNYKYGNAIPKYRNALAAVLNGEEEMHQDAQTKAMAENIWKKSYNAIANINNLLQEIEKCNDTFEYDWEKDMIMAEARGLRALLHFELLQLFVPAPVTGYTGTAIPYVTTYPDLAPSRKSLDECLKLVIEDLEYAQETLAPIDIDEMRNKSNFVSGTTRLDDMDYVLFQGVGNIQPDGGKRDNAMSEGGFFAFRGFRFNYWSATGMLARVYSYMRNFEKAEDYADTIIEWVRPNQFNLYKKNPKATNPNAIDGKRRPEPILAFWNDKVCEDYTTEVGTIYHQTVELSYLFEGDETADYRYTVLYNPDNLRYRVWDGQDAAFSANSTIQKYSNPLIPVLELPEIYFIKAECQAQAGLFTEAAATLKKIRDARACTQPVSTPDMETFMDKLVNEAERDFLTRGTTFTFLKKLNWPTMYDGTPVRQAIPESWYVLPIPDSETVNY